MDDETAVVIAHRIFEVYRGLDRLLSSREA
jgi:hypothetical protein